MDQRQDLVRDAADRGRRDLQVVHLGPEVADVAVAGAACVEGDDLAVEIGGELSLALGQDLGLEAAITIAGCGDLDGANGGPHALPCFAITSVACARGGLLIEVNVEFSFQALFEELFDERRQHAVGVGAQQGSSVFELLVCLLLELLEVKCVGVRIGFK